MRLGGGRGPISDPLAQQPRSLPDRSVRPTQAPSPQRPSRIPRPPARTAGPGSLLASARPCTAHGWRRRVAARGAHPPRRREAQLVDGVMLAAMRDDEDALPKWVWRYLDVRCEAEVRRQSDSAVVRGTDRQKPGGKDRYPVRSRPISSKSEHGANCEPSGPRPLRVPTIRGGRRRAVQQLLPAPGPSRPPCRPGSPADGRRGRPRGDQARRGGLAHPPEPPSHGWRTTSGS